MGLWICFLLCDFGAWFQCWTYAMVPKEPTVSAGVQSKECHLFQLWWEHWLCWADQDTGYESLIGHTPAHGCFQDEFWLYSKLTWCPDIRTSPLSMMRTPWISFAIFLVDSTCWLYTQALTQSTVFGAKEISLNSTGHQIGDREPDHEERGKNKLGRCVELPGSREEAAEAEASTMYLKDVKKKKLVLWHIVTQARMFSITCKALEQCFCNFGILGTILGGLFVIMHLSGPLGVFPD